MIDVGINPEEVLLDDTKFKIVGPLVTSRISSFAAKVVTGDYDKDSEVVASNWITSDQRGGILVEEMEESIHGDRCYWSTCNIRHKGHVILGPLVNQLGASTYTSPIKFANFNGELYFAKAAGLYSLNEAANDMDAISDSTSFSSLSDIFVHGNTLILFADERKYISGGYKNYATMSTGESVTYKGDLGSSYTPKWGVSLKSVLYAMDDNGQFYTIDNITATDKTALPSQGTPKGLFLYRDQYGDFRVHCPTTDGLWLYDDENDVWQRTDLKLPEHDACGNGFVHWREGCYISAGLDVHKYIAASTATISQVGLNRDDGLPVDFRGEIKALIEGYNEFWALVDSSEVEGTGYSTVMSRNETAWNCTWVASTSDDTMECGLVSPASSEYRLYFTHDSKIYYIDLPTDMLNPLKVSTTTYAASGYHITPWFDADVATWDKIGVRMRVFCSQITADETVTIYYRKDYEDTTLDADNTNWKKIAVFDTSNYNGENIITLGGGEGISFKSIQFKFELARGATTTNTPDIRWYSLAYIKITNPEPKAYRLKIDCSGGHGNKTALQLHKKLQELDKKKTFYRFSYRDESEEKNSIHWVRIANIRYVEPTGRNYNNIYDLSLVEP